jgi:MYXO-CTERM domain-containing protein
VVKTGCGCRTAGDAPDGERNALSAFGVLAFAGALRGRARRRAR